MAAKRTILISLMLGASLLLAACGGSSSHSTPPAAAISIALNPKPSTTTVMVGNTTGLQLTAVVSDDSSNSGVDWAITCPAYTATGTSGFQPAGGGGPFPCGTLSIAPTMHTASGKAVTYVPPSYLPSGDTTVTIVAFATADHTQNVTTPVAVNSYANVLKGTYVLQVQGTDGVNPYQTTGAFAFDGKGNITSGEETYNTIAAPYSAAYTLQGSSGTPSSYFIGADGRGTMTLNVQQVSNPVNLLTQNLTFVVNSSAKALVADIGDFQNGIQYTLSGSGTLELQDSTAASTMPTGSYAFVTNGTDSGANLSLGTVEPTAIGGVLNIDSTGSISSAGSLADQDYYSSAANRKLSSCPPASLSGTLSPLDSFGSFSMLLIGASCFGQPPKSAGSIQLTGYIVDSATIRLIESDYTNGSSGFLTAGLAVRQAVPTGGFSASSLSGYYVFGISGIDLNAGPFGLPSPSSFTSSGAFNADGNGNFTGETDTLFLSSSSNLTMSAPDTPIHGTYVLDSASNAIGRASLKPVIFRGNVTPHPNLLLYLTGNGSAPLALWSDGNDANSPSVGTGVAYVQSPNPSTLVFSNSESYGVNFTAANAATGTEDNGSGPVTANNGAWSGTIDDLFNNITVANTTPLSFLGTYPLSADSFGRLSGNGGFAYDLANGFPPTSQVAYYMIDNNHAFFVETDLLSLSNGGQVGFGYFEQACDVTSATSCQAAAQAAKKKPSSQGRKGNVGGSRTVRQW